MEIPAVLSGQSAHCCVGESDLGATVREVGGWDGLRFGHVGEAQLDYGGARLSKSQVETK